VVTEPLVGVLALQGDVREHVAALRAAGARAMPVRRPGELAELDGIVLPGGESTTMSRLLGVFELLEPLRARITDGLPVYGSCAGMILLAKEVLDGRADQQQLGGLDIVVRRNAFGRQGDSFEADLAVTGVPGGPVHAVFIRAPWVEAAADHVEVLAAIPDDAGDLGDSGEPSGAAGKIVAVRQGRVMATAFHPELTGDGRVHQLFVRMIRGDDSSAEKS
jgi:5'-phosphate synthase pdxT subunit